jgi:type II secretory pathway component PulJ
LGNAPHPLFQREGDQGKEFVWEKRNKIMKFSMFNSLFSTNQRGFTMVELLLYMGIYSILMVVLMQIFTSILSVHAESQANSAVDQDTNYILSRMTQDLHTATNVVTPSLGTSGTALHIIGAGKDITYSISGNTMTLTDNNTLTTDRLNSVDTDATASFLPIGNATPGSKVSVKVILTITSRIIREGNRHQTQTIETTIGTR